MTNKSSSRTKASKKYNEANSAQLNLRLAPSIVQGLKLYCNNKEISQRELISQLICEKIERDTGKSFDDFLKENQEEPSTGPGEPSNTENE